MAQVLKFRTKAVPTKNPIPDYSKQAKFDFKLTRDELRMIKEIRDMPIAGREKVFGYASGTHSYYATM